MGSLSGGERKRLQLATLLRSGGNVLLLDEPTNGLDVDTLRALEEALLGLSGCDCYVRKGDQLADEDARADPSRAESNHAG